MIDINGRKYNLCLFDTNILSELLLDPNKWLHFFNDFFGLDKSIISYSISSLTELWYRRDLFEKYVDIFSILPSAMLDSYHSIFEKEISNYRDRNQINPILIAPFAVRARGLSPKQTFVKLLEQSGFKEKTESWPRQQKEVLEAILDLRKNYPPKGDTYSISEIEKFVFMVTTDQIGARNSAFARHILGSDHALDIDRFPSVKTTSYLVFYKFYGNKRKPVFSDVVDIMIPSVSPYVDAFLTEKNLAHIIRTIKLKHHFLSNLPVYSLKELRDYLPV